MILEVGDKLLVELDDDGYWTGKWIEVDVKGIAVCHNPRKNDVLDPYVLVRVDHPELIAFNYSLYCERGRVKAMRAKYENKD